MVKPVWKRIGCILLSALLAAAGLLSLFLPYLINTNAKEKKYLCTWQDGSVGVETYASVYPDFVIGEEGALRLLRGDLYGEIQPTKYYLAIIETLKAGGLAELLAISTEGDTRLERLALWRMTRGTVWYSAGYFVWKGDGIEEVKSAQGERLILLSGSISAARLSGTGATSLELRAEAELSEKAFEGTSLQSITAHPPYIAEGGAVYLDTGEGVRLIAALPTVTALTVKGNDYADEGALLFSQKLTSVTLPFAGSAPVWSNYFYGEVAYLFSSGKEYFVPPALTRVKITGGLLVPHAFYRMDGVEEIDLCGMDANQIAADALIDCTALKHVHSPNADLKLSGDFTAAPAPCGCTVFERMG